MLLIHNCGGGSQKKKNVKQLIEHISFIIHFTHCYLQDVGQFKQFIGAIVVCSMWTAVAKISSYVIRATRKFLWFFFLLFSMNVTIRGHSHTHVVAGDICGSSALGDITAWVFKIL